MSSSRIRKILLPTAIVVLALVATVILIKTRPSPERREPTTPRPVVEAYLVGDDTDAVHVRGFGTVRAKRKVNLTPQVGGEIVEKSSAFEPGAEFAAGELLLRIDETDYALAAAQAEANVARAEYDLARAEEEAQVARDAWKRSGDGEASALVLHEPQLKLARSNLASAEAAWRQARVNLARCTVTAPFDGKVVAADVDAGQYLRPGTAVGVIIASDVAEVTVPVADNDLGWIHLQGEEPATQVTIRAEFAGEIHEWSARPVRIGGAVDERSRLVPVVIEIEDPFAAGTGRPPLIEGMFVEVDFATPPPRDAVVIPRSALRRQDQVWVIRDDSTLEIREVTVARAGVDEAVIRAGLEPGERLCMSNLQLVTTGLPVRVEGEPAPDGAAAAGNAPKGGTR